MSSQTKVFSLEGNLINPNKWEEHKNNVPPEKWALLHDESGPIGLGFTPETGYYIIASGQGPFVVWMEKEHST